MDVRSPSGESRAAPFRNRRGRHGRPSRRRLFLAALGVALAALLAATIVALTGGGSGGMENPASGPVARVGAGVPGDWPAWGFTHTQNSVDRERGPAKAMADLARAPVVQVTPIMGWGVDNPQPRPGEYNWGSLDRRMETIKQAGGVPVITLCCAPDWMKGGPAGGTDWTKLELAVEPEHFDAFAAMAAEVAKRYPQVRYYTVWNEFKGFWYPPGNRWDYQGYTALYNKVYGALKKVDEGIRVGGPYMVMNSNAPGPAGRYGPPSDLKGAWGSMDRRNLDAVRYWSRHKKGADFIVVDGHSQPVQRQIKLDDFQALAKFSDVTRWLRALEPELPVWWAEWYVEPEPSDWTAGRRLAVHTAAMMEFVRGGASSALYWSPQTTTAADCPGCLWSGARAGGGATPTLAMLQNFNRWFRPGTGLVDVKVSDPAVRALAQDKQMVVVNGSAKAVRPRVDGKPLDLGPYEVRWLGR